jgi:hypothetical protein
MKKIFALVVMVFGLGTEVYAQPEPKKIVELSVVTTVDAEGISRRILYSVFEARLLATPEWNPDSTKPPLSLAHARKIAEDWMRKNGDERARFESHLIGVRRNRRYYILNFEKSEGAPDLKYAQAVVLMDGALVLPAVSTLVHSPTPSSSP